MDSGCVLLFLLLIGLIAGAALYRLNQAVPLLRRAAEERGEMRRQLAAVLARLEGGAETAPAPEAAEEAEPAPPEAAPATVPWTEAPGPLAEPPAAPSEAEPEPPAEAEPEPEPEPAPALPLEPPPLEPPPPPAPSEPWWTGLEERLGARLPVWLGAFALALAGIFLVKYSVEQGWIGPAVRIALGVGFGAVLLVAGQLLRRPARPIAAGLAAAGVAVLYAAFLAAVHLYDLLPPAVGFLLMALTTALAVVLSLVHGPIVAVVGMVGGFLTPSLIRLGEPDPRLLFGYLFVLHAGLLVVARRRSWSLLGAASLLGGFVWVLVWLVGPYYQRGDGPWLQLFLLAALVAWGAAAAMQREEGGRGPAWGLVLASAVALLALVTVTGLERFGPLEWAFVLLTVAGLIAVGRLLPRFMRPPPTDAGAAGLAALPWLAAAAAAVLLLVQGLRLALVGAPGVGEFLTVAAALWAVVALGGWLALWGARRPALWASLSALAGIGYPFLAWLGWRASEPPGPRTLAWTAVALGLAVVYAAGAVPVGRRRREDGMEPALAALAVAVTVQASWAATLALDGNALVLTLALEVAALAWLAGRFALPVLATLAAVAAAAVAVWLLLSPTVLNGTGGEPLVFNAVLWVYGGAALAFAAAVWLLERRGPRDGWVEPVAGRVGVLSEALRWLVLAFVVALLHLSVHHGFHRPDVGGIEPPFLLPFVEARGLMEWSAYAVVWLALGTALLAAARRWPRALGTVHHAGGPVVILGLVLAVAWPLLAANPLWTPWSVGSWPLFNHLLWIYGAPALLTALAARELRLRDGGGQRLATACRVAALLFLFVLVTLEVRQAFHGAVLSAAPTGAAERWATSAAWALLGTALLIAGILTTGRLLRAASLVVMGLTVVKVFLLDVARLGDLYRVLSFLALGITLLLLAWLYQRFVFTARS